MLIMSLLVAILAQPVQVAAPASAPAPVVKVAAGSAAPAAKADDPNEEMALQIIEEMAAAVQKSGTDCAQMATALLDFRARRGADIKAMKAADALKTDEQKKAMMEKHKARIEAAVGLLMPGMTACAANEGVQKAISDM